MKRNRRSTGSPCVPARRPRALPWKPLAKGSSESRARPGKLAVLEEARAERVPGRERSGHACRLREGADGDRAGDESGRVWPAGPGRRDGGGVVQHGSTGLDLPVPKAPSDSNTAVPWNGAGTTGLAGFVLNGFEMLHVSNSIP